MQQDNSQIYYMVVDEKSTGPYTLDQITLHPQLTPETLVWKPGIENWEPAKNFPELSPAFINKQPPHTPPNYNHHYNPEETDSYNRFANNPQYREGHTYNNPNYNRPPYERYDRYQHQGYRPTMRTNWLPWAIVATIVGFFASCIGAIFGIIGIVQANKANTLYSQGYDSEGDTANSSAKTMTIIGLIFAGLGILAMCWFGSLFNNLANISSF